MSALVTTEILSLSVAERIQLAEDIWDSVIEFPESVSLSETEKIELELRLDAYHRKPDEGSLWAVVRERIRNRM